MIPFDVLDRKTSVHQSLLLEASAGTGKTFSIENIVVRLLIEGEPISLQEILVVSFTKATAADLKTRIRQNINAILKQFSMKTETCPDYVQALMEKSSKEIEKAKNRLQLALLGFDEAQIFTIHAFCKKMIEEMGWKDMQREQITPKEIQKAIHDFFRTGLTENIFSSSQLERVLQHYRFDLDSLENGIGEIIVSAPTLRKGKTFLDLFKEFDQEMKIFSRKYTSQDILNEFTSKAPLYNGIYDRKRSIKKEIWDHVVKFSSLLDLPEWKISDFDDLILQGFPFSLYFDPSKSKSGLAPPLKIDFERLSNIIEQARDVNLIFSQMAEGCQKRLQEYLDQEEKFRYDDLLHDMWQASFDPAFVKALQKKYRAVLIDEFQDTDPLQWEIFKRVFLPSSYLYLVGDPKQSIYAFRQADIYTYLDAAEYLGAQNRAFLGVNFRSQSSLVHCLNELFSSENLQGLLVLPKIDKKIPYQSVKASQKQDKAFKDEKGSVHFLIVEKEQGRGKTWPTKECEVDSIFPYLVNEIYRLKKRDGVPFSDWAILVKDKYQGELFIEYCKQQRLPVVSQWAKTVRSTLCYPLLKDLFFSVLHPHDTSSLKYLLIAPFCGWKLEEILNWDSSKHLLAKTKILNLKQKLYSEGVSAFLFSFLDSIWKEDQKTVFERILNNPELLQEYQQISNQLIVYESEKKTSPEGIYQYLLQIEEEHTIQDDNTKEAVHVMTTHMSKGLEFPIVATLGLTKRSIKVNHKILFETEEIDQSQFLKLQDPNKKMETAIEEDAEKLRQLYVASTRAKYRVYIPFAIQTDLKKALEPGESSPLELYFNEVTTQKKLSVVEFLQQIQKKAPITFEKIDFSPFVEPFAETKIAGEMKSPSNFTIPGKSVYIRSFSSLSTFEDESSFSQEENVLSHSHCDLSKEWLVLPRGKETGILIHKIFEQLPFEFAKNPAKRREVIEGVVKNTHLKSWVSLLDEIIFATLTQPIECGGNRFQLSEILSDKMFRETEFLFSLKDRFVFQEWEENTDFLKGVIDLLFEYKNKFYIVDWKTNYLESYGREQLEEAIHKHNYSLQESIYREAVRKFLSKLGYNFDAVFGGSLYFFVRGANISRVNSGIYIFI